MLDRLQFLLGEAFIALRRNGWMTFAAISTVAVSLFLIGGLGYFYFELSKMSEGMTGKFELRVMLKDGTKQAYISQTAAQIRQIAGVKQVNWIPRDRVWKKFLAENPENLKYVDIDNPYPDSFKITLSDLKRTDAVIAEIKKLPAVVEDEVQYLQAEQQWVEQLQAIVRWLGTALGGLLFATAGILIYNAIRLTVISRRLEIRIMQLVGASFLTVRIPFYIEGIVQGAVGGLFATLLIWACDQVIASRVAGLAGGIANFPPFPTSTYALALSALGAGYGLLCSMVAVRAPLRYR